MALHRDVQLNVLWYLSFQDLFNILDLDESRGIWNLHGLRGLWASYMDRYSGSCSVIRNNDRGTNITWEWVEQRRWRLRQMDLYINAREQGQLAIYSPSVVEYITSSARVTVEGGYEDSYAVIEFTRQYDLWARRGPPVGNILFLDDNDTWTINVNFRRITFRERMLPRVNPPGIILPRLRPINPPIAACTMHEMMNSLYWEYW